MNRRQVLLCLALAPAWSCGGSASPNRAQPSPSRVATLFASIRAGEYYEVRFPELQPADIPELIAIAEDPTTLTRFPTNPFSSRLQKTCSVGVLALWLVEGIRKQAPAGWPSLNPLCVERGEKRGPLIPQSEANRPKALQAYRSWWERAKSDKTGTVWAQDPLAETGLYWG